MESHRFVNQGARYAPRKPSPPSPLPLMRERGASRGTLRAHIVNSGFTLIEIMVVLLIVAITIGMVGINLQRGDNNRVQEETDRIVILLQAAREEAILQGQVFAVQFSEDGYRFLRLNHKGKLELIEQDDVLAPRSLPDGVTLSFTMDGAVAETEAGLVLDPSGSFIPFVLTLHAGEATWQAHGLANGKIQSIPPEPLHAG